MSVDSIFFPYKRSDAQVYERPQKKTQDTKEKLLSWSDCAPMSV